MLPEAIVITLQILILTVSWTLFQRARADLSARAAESPVLQEIRNLERSVRVLLKEMELQSAEASDVLGAHCRQAREILDALEAASALHAERAQTARSSPEMPTVPFSTPAGAQTLPPDAGDPPACRTGELDESQGTADPAEVQKRQLIYHLADAGAPVSEVAHAAGISEGFVEVLLALRGSRQL